MRFVQVRLVATDVLRLAEFYRQLTQREAMGSEDYVELHLADAGIAISSQRAADLYGVNAAAAAQNRSAIIDLEVDDVDAERTRLAPILADLVLEPVTQPWGNRAMMFRDPDGNLINLFSRGEPK
jgi:uncharacterized glyoxalase superfamily protein PhnB